MNRRDLKEQKGITLTAVLLIIIILVLAVITTLAIMITNGIFDKSKDSDKEGNNNNKNNNTAIKIKVAGKNNADQEIELNRNNAGEYYGYKVATSTYDVADATWRLFYIDFDNEYGDGAGTIYLKADGITRSEGLSTETYNVKNVTKFNRGYTPTDATETRNTAVSWLLNPSNWTTYKVEAKANYAVGGPSLEMYVKSYNQFIASHTGLNGTYTDVQPLEYNYGGAGYYVGLASTGTGGYNSSCSTKYTNNCSLINSTANRGQTNQVKVQISMYNPGIGNYWLASPSADGKYSLTRVFGGVSYVSGSHYSRTHSVWPLVSLKSDVQVTLVGEDS